MPKNKRPNRKPGKKKPGKRAGGESEAGKAPDGGKVVPAPGSKAVPKTYGTPKSSRSSISPAMSRRSTRGR